MDLEQSVELVTRWLPFYLSPSVREAGQPEPQLVELRLPPGETDWQRAIADDRTEIVQAWPVDAVLMNFAYNAAHWHIVAREHEATTRKPAVTQAELEQWAALTRSLADRVPFSGASRQTMRNAAAQIEHALNWRARWFVRAPESLDTMADANWRTSLNLWAMDRLLRAVNETEPAYATIRSEATEGASVEHVQIPPTKFWPAVFDDWFPADQERPAFTEYKEARKRVTRFDETVRPDHRDALMTTMLRDVLHDGHFGSDGKPRARPNVH